MYPQQFDYGNLYGGFGGFNPYASFGGWGSYSPFPMGYGYGGMLSNLGSLFGGASPYDDLFSSFQTKLDDLFKGYQEQLNANAADATEQISLPADAATTGGTTDTATQSKQVDYSKKTSKYGSQAEKQAAYDKLMNDPNASAEAKAMAEKGNVYKATTMNQPTLAQQSQTMINKINAENSARPVPIDGMIGQVQGKPINSLLAPGLKMMPKSTVDLSQQKLTPATLEELNTKIKNRPQQGMKLQPFQSQIGSLFGSTGTGYAKNPNPAQKTPRYR